MREMSRPVLSLLASFGLAAACGGRAVSAARTTSSAGADSSLGGAGDVSGGASSIAEAGRPFDAGVALANGGAAGVERAVAGAGGASSPDTSANAGGAVSNGANSGAGTGTAGSTSNACSNTTWTATASVLCVPEGEGCPGWPPQPQTPAQAIDGDAQTRYTSGRAQTGNEQFAVTFPALVTLTGISLTSVKFGESGDDGPALYAVEYSTDGVTFTPFDPPLAGSGSGSEALPIPNTGGFAEANELTLSFLATTMKAIKVKQTGSKGFWWSIREFSVAACRTD
jgi:hypothetical protein